MFAISVIWSAKKIPYTLFGFTTASKNKFANSTMQYMRIKAKKAKRIVCTFFFIPFHDLI